MEACGLLIDEQSVTDFCSKISSNNLEYIVIVVTVTSEYCNV